MSNNINQEKFEFKAEMKQLLDIIIHSLYTNTDIFVRELVSNASDALNKIRFEKLTNTNVLDFDSELEIKIKLDKETKTFSIQDTGIGMNKEDLINKLGTIASSGTKQFISNLKENKSKIDGNLIGQFGVGFYSIFMVTDEVVVESRNHDLSEKGYRWISNGENDFTIEEIDLKTRGTKISFKLKEDYSEFSEDWKIKNILSKYSNFIDFPISVNEEKIEKTDAIWYKKKDSISDNEYKDFYKFISNDYNEPLSWLHLNIEGNINFNSILYLPKNAPNNLFSEDYKKTIHIYTNRVFIQDNAEHLLPDYLKFVKGVLDTEDLPLNVSRELTQNTPRISKISSILTKKILTWLEELSKEKSEDYINFFKNFGPMFKLGVNSDFENKTKIMSLLRYESTTTNKGEFTSFDEYISRMSENQNDILYITGESREALEKNPNIEYFKKNNIEVLLLTDPSDVFTVPYFGQYENKNIISIDKYEIKEETENKDEEKVIDKNLSESLMKAIKKVLDEKIEDVVESKRLVDSPVTLVSGKNGLDQEMERMMKLMDKNFTSSKKILEVNLKHPLIKNISNLYLSHGENSEFDELVNQLYDSALLLSGELKTPNDFVQRLYNFMEKATA